MSKRARIVMISLAGILLLGFLLLQIPSLRSRLLWRYEVWTTRLQNALDPVVIPTPQPSTPFPTFTPPPPTPTADASASATPSPTAVPLPPQVHIPSPDYEKQDINNCGPATLSMALRMYGWQGSQYDVAAVVKPVKQDRNVNPEELRYYILNEAGWLKAEYRVAGTLDLLKRLLAANYPVIVEVASKIDQQDANGPNDDLWDAHYLLVNGYDEAEKTFLVQDSQHGAATDADKKVPYETLEQNWKPFNYLYMVIYFPQDEAEIQSILGADWDPDLNRQRALDLANADVAADPQDAFGWFNLGASLTYFERYQEAALAFDQAFTIGLPQRMTRYQFWPFVAYFNADRADYLLELTEKTYKPINGWYAEEALLWHGWGLWKRGDLEGAVANWRKALQVHPGYKDAIYALQFVGVQP
ncbi:MAG: C39 family peptidase [Anaerolineales bacterium]|nr:MAG: C39 family peptidase [Anaerolineales bacterium]